MKRLFLFLLLPGTAFGQTIITLEPGAQFFIGANATVAFDKLVLQPTAPLLLPAGNQLTKTTALLHPSGNRSIRQAFQFSNAVPGFTGTITLFYEDADLNGLAEATLTLNVHDGSRWAAHPATARDATANLVTTEGLTNLLLRELTLASLDAPLPVRFASNTISCNTSGAVVLWSTAGEVDNSHFEIERSPNGINWQNAGSVAGGGTTTGTRHYRFQDAAAALFYRLVQVDLGGRRQYGPVMRSNCTGKAIFEVYPNPFADRVTVLVSSVATANEVFSIYNQQGQVVQRISQRLQPGNNYLSISLRHLPAGTYRLSRQSKEGSGVTLIKQ